MRRSIFAFLSIFILLGVLLHAEAPTRESVTRLYVATFKRAPDSTGLNYWTNNSGLTLSQIAQSFFDQPETQILYPPETSNRDFIKSVYANLFNREPDEAGWDYWEKELNRGAFSKNRFIEAVINGAQDSDVSFDATILSNKTTVSLYFTENNLDDITLAKKVMINIDASSQSVIDAEAMIDLYIINGGGGSADSEFIPNHTFDERGDSWVLANGATIEVPPGAVSGSTSIDFKKTNKPEDLGEEAIVYAFSSDREIENASFALPIEFSGIEGKKDLVLSYERQKDSAYKIIDFQYNAAQQTVSFTINNNWDFQNIPENAKGSVKESGEAQDISSHLATIYVIKKMLIHKFLPIEKMPIPMPFYVQMDGTCWATAGKMMQKSLYPIGRDPGYQIYDFMKIHNIPINIGLPLWKGKSFSNIIAHDKNMRVEDLRLASTANYRIRELLNQNHPVIFHRNGHIVLVVGYTEDGNVLIQHNPQYPYVGGGMYQRMEFHDSFETGSLLGWVTEKFEMIQLIWAEADQDPNRAVQTVGIPSLNEIGVEDYPFYFTAPDLIKKSRKVKFYFDNSLTMGYGWKLFGDGSTKIIEVMPKTIDKLILELPVWNADLDHSAAVTLAVKLYEKNNPSNEIHKKLDFSMSPKSYETKNFEFDVKPLLTSLETNSNFILNIELIKGVKSISDIRIEKIVLQPTATVPPVTAPPVCSKILDGSIPIVGRSNGFYPYYWLPQNSSSNQEYACTRCIYYHDSHELIHETQYICRSGYVPIRHGQDKSYELPIYEFGDSGKLTGCEIFDHGQGTGSCMP